MANLLTTTIDGSITEKKGSAVRTTATIAAQSTAAKDNIVKTAGFAEYSTSSTSEDFNQSVAYDANLNRVVISYLASNGGPYSFVVGTPSVDGENITFGDAVNWTTSGGSSTHTASSYDITQQRVLVVGERDNKYYARVINASGSNPHTMGTLTTWMDPVNGYGPYSFSAEGMTYDANRQKHVLAYNHSIYDSSTVHFRVIVGTVVGGSTNSIDFNTPATNYFQIDNTEGKHAALTYHVAAQKVVLVYIDGDNKGSGCVGTVAANGTITFGSVTRFADDCPPGSTGNVRLSISYDTILQKVVVCYQNDDINVFGRVILGTVTGTNISFGDYPYYGLAAGPSVQVAPTTSPARRTSKMSIEYDTISQKHIVYYKAATAASTDLGIYAKAGTILSSTLSCVKNSSTTVTTASTSTLSQYMYVSGTGIPAGAIIASITNSTTFVLSSAATDSLTSTLTFTRITFGSEKVVETPDVGKSFIDYTDSHRVYNLVSAYMSNSSVKKTIVCRPGRGSDASPGISKATLTHLNHSILTIDLALGNFFELDLENAEGPIGTITINNPSATHVSSFILKITQGSHPNNPDILDNDGHSIGKSPDTQDMFDWSLLTAFKWIGGIAPTLTVSNDKIDILSFTTYDNGTTWYGSVVGQNNPHATTPSNLFGERGVLGGLDEGTSGNTGLGASMEYITISTLGNALTFGNLTVAREQTAATSDASRGVWAGGDRFPVGSQVAVDTIDYITIATIGNATDFGDLTSARQQLMAATSNGSRGVFGGGEATNGVAQNIIDYITIATAAGATDFGDLTSAREKMAATGDDVRGIFAGGTDTSPATVNTMDYITIATISNAIDFGDLTEARNNQGACSDGSRGVWAGGGSSTLIHSVTISTTSNAVTFGHLLDSKRYLGATSNGSRGVFMGDYPPSNMPSQYITISTPSTASIFGDTTIIRDTGSATSGN